MKVLLRNSVVPIKGSFISLIALEIEKNSLNLGKFRLTRLFLKLRHVNVKGLHRQSTSYQPVNNTDKVSDSSAIKCFISIFTK